MQLVQSLRHFYPGIRILIADDSFEETPSDDELPAEVAELKRMEDVHWYQLSFDTGLSAGRNHLVRQSTKPFVAVLDDDFVITEETRLEDLLTILDAEPTLGLVAGLLRQGDWGVRNWAGHFRFSEDPEGTRRLIIDPLHSAWQETGGLRYRRTDLAYNAFVARHDVLLRCPWDEGVKVDGEHLDFFLSLYAQGVSVAYTPNVIFGHLQARPSGYVAYRKRRREFMPRVVSKWGLQSPPDHRATRETGLPVRSAKEMWRKEHDPRPNIVVFGVGHSGTTILSKMLTELGWNAGPADEQYAEHVPVRRLNIAALKSGRLNGERATKLVEQLPGPWVVKDPRLVNTIGLWMPVLEAYQPLLLWITRDIDEVKRSYRRRGESLTLRGGKSVEETFRMAERTFQQWPWAKLRVEYEQLQSAVKLFDVDRNGGHHG